MTENPTKICSKCGAEYAPEAQVCADCGGKLVFSEAYAKGFEAPKDDADLVCVREDRLGYLQELERHMNRNGIRTVIRFHGQVPESGAAGARYGLYVTSADEAKAKVVDRDYWIRGAPEHATSYEYTEQESSGVCPACSSALPENSAECPECGLAVGTVMDVMTCPACDSDVESNAETCPNCGAEFE